MLIIVTLLFGEPGELVIIRINIDEAFLFEAIDKATTFFKYGVLPELVAKWYTRPSYSSIHAKTSSQALAISSDPQESTVAEKYCFCQKNQEQ